MLPTVGRIVHYTLPRGRGKGEVCSAEIVRVWNDRCVNLHVKLDGSNHAGMGSVLPGEGDPLVVWETSVAMAEAGAVGDAALGKWFWPPRV